MNTAVVMDIERMFFWMGAFDHPNNPDGIPDILPFKLILNREPGLLSQQDSPQLREALRKAYDYGSTVGNAMDDSPLGRNYCEDFLSFIQKSIKHKGRLLEIGAGTGYLASQLIKHGYNVTAMEPGKAQAECWEKYKVTIIRDYFPSPKITEKYDGIIFYGVLEHVHDYKAFLHQIKEHLEPDGHILLAVPDCSLEIGCGDPSMLLHEHYHYFTDSSLRCVLRSFGLQPSIKRSRYGRALYADAPVSTGINPVEPDQYEMRLLDDYSHKVNHFVAAMQQHMERTLREGTLGIYCPARALSFLPYDSTVRFFDDAPNLHGKYYPPFKSRIESRDELLNNPPDNLWIMSRTFGSRIRDKIKDLLPRTNIRLMDELLDDSQIKTAMVSLFT